MIAALPMYDWPELRPATDTFWARFARRLVERGIDAPAVLERSRPSTEVWRDPNLLFSQTCGFPYVSDLRATVQLLATPVYRVEGCRVANYSSRLVAAASALADRLEDLEIDAIAVNDRQSFSGHVALRAALAQISGRKAGDFQVILTGSHRASLAAVAGGQADLCAVDPVCWALAGRFDRDVVDTLKVIGHGPEAPGLPFITSRQTSADRCQALRRALMDQLGDPDCADLCAELHLGGARLLADADYDHIRQIAEFALPADAASAP